MGHAAYFGGMQIAKVGEQLKETLPVYAYKAKNGKWLCLTKMRHYHERGRVSWWLNRISDIDFETQREAEIWIMEAYNPRELEPRYWYFDGVWDESRPDFATVKVLGEES